MKGKSLEEMENEIIGNIREEITLEKLRKLAEEGRKGEVYSLINRVKIRLKQILSNLDDGLESEAWELIYNLRNLAITRCNIEDRNRREFEELMWEE